MDRSRLPDGAWLLHVDDVSDYLCTWREGAWHPHQDWRIALGDVDRGGAALTPLMGKVADVSGVAHAYLVPAGCFCGSRNLCLVRIAAEASGCHRSFLENVNRIGLEHDSGGRPTAVQSEERTVDEGCLTGAEIADHRGYFLRLAEPSHRLAGL